MEKIRSSIRPARDFWTNRQQRKTVMWVLLAVSVLVLVFGVYTAIDGQRQYMTSSDDIKSIQNRLSQLELPYMVEENGQTQLDLSQASQEDQMMLALVKREELQARNHRADAFNQRSTGIRIIGIAVVGFALTYLVAPERKREPASDATNPVPPSPDEPPFDLSN
jgi:flagellar biosynthesis/type III secretory pathway M-ring protein FliF/YscJ